MFPAVVSMIAVGWAAVVAGFFAAELVWWGVAVCAASGSARQQSREVKYLRMLAPERKTEKELYDTDDLQVGISSRPAAIRDGASVDLSACQPAER